MSDILNKILDDIKDIRDEQISQGKKIEIVYERVDNTYEQAVKTNGRVTELERRQIAEDAVTKSRKDNVKIEKVETVSVKKGFTLSWEKILFFIGSLATLIAYVIEKIS